MHKILIINAFNKARIEREKHGEKSPSLTNIAEDLASFVKESQGLGLDERNYRNYFSDARRVINNSEDISIKQLKVINGLCEFLNFANYEDFKNSLGEKSFSKSSVSFLWKNKMVLVMLIGFLACVLIYYSINKQSWMIWDGNSYIEVKFDAEKLSSGTLKLYKKERIEHFKKIIPDCKTIFFNENGHENIWYGKNTFGELEYFTSFGLHPETEKTLKKITLYMVRKHICEDY